VFELLSCRYLIASISDLVRLAIYIYRARWWASIGNAGNARRDNKDLSPGKVPFCSISSSPLLQH